MDPGNETPSFECRFLEESYFDLLLEKFGEAFADYARPFDLDPVKFRNHIKLNAIDLSRSVGCFEREVLIGFSLNGFGNWQGKKTVYDAGTGVIPSRRRLGASEAMFRFMVPKFKDDGIDQFLLEVITTNTPAINLYEKLGFEIQRELLLLEASASVGRETQPSQHIKVREMTAADLGRMKELWDAQPSWQNSNEAIARCEDTRTILGAFIEGECVGYVAFSKSLGRIAQFVIDAQFRNGGVGSTLIAEVQARTEPEAKMQVINLDNILTDSVEFFTNRGFSTALAQYEMILKL